MGVSRHLGWPPGKVQAALNYAKAFPAEIGEALEENDNVDFETLKLLLPQAKDFSVGKKKPR
jgi:hypothetical protein